MLRDEAVTAIKEGLGFRKDMDATIIQKLQQAQRTLEGGMKLPWFIVNEDSPVELLLGVPEYELSDAFIREVDDSGYQQVARSTNGDLYHVRKLQYDRAISTYGFSEAYGPPQAYTIRAHKMRIFPTPDADYSYRWHFYQRQTPLTANIENQWLKHVPDLLIGMAGEWTAQNLRDGEALAYFGSLRQRWEAWMAKEIELRDLANLPVVMGSDL